MNEESMLNAMQEREYNRDEKTKAFLIDRQAEYEAYTPFNKVVQLLFGNMKKIDPLIPVKGKKGIIVTRRKDNLKSVLANDVNIICTSATEYALSIGNDDLLYAVRFRTRDVIHAKDGNVSAIITTITAALTPLLSDKEFQEYEITGQMLSAITEQAEAFSDTRGQAKVIDTNSAIANGDLDDVFKAIRANIASLRRLVLHFSKTNPGFVTGFNASVAVDNSGIRHNGIEGKVTNPFTGEPVEGAVITGEGYKKVVKTDVRGYFRLIRLQARDMKITIAADGYEPQVIDVKIIRGRMIECNIALKTKPVSISATA